MSTLGKAVAFIASLFVFFVLPVTYHAQKQEALHQVYVQNAAQTFVDQAASQGCLTKEMYLDFIEAIDATGNLYEIRMEHAHVITEPETDGSGRIMGYYEYKESSFEKDMLEEILKTSGRYAMSKGDYFSVTLYNRSDTYAETLEKMIYGIPTGEHAIFATAGGRIRDGK